MPTLPSPVPEQLPVALGDAPLLHYDAACRAIADAKRVDDVTQIRDGAEVLRAYARIAKNKALEIDAAEIRIRAERKLGVLIVAQKESIGLGRPGPKPAFGSAAERNSPPTLAEAGIDKKLSMRAQHLAAVPDHEFESRIASWRDLTSRGTEPVTTHLVRRRRRKDVPDSLEFPRYDETLPTDYRCPRCTYEWSGNPKPPTFERDAP
jgi:hypothetical protein